MSDATAAALAAATLVTAVFVLALVAATLWGAVA